jgi:hypothetical protein
MGDMLAFGDGSLRLLGDMRVEKEGSEARAAWLRTAGWLLACFLLAHAGGAPAYSQPGTAAQRVPPGGPRVRVAGTTNTQAVLTYTAPDSGACTVRVSQQSSLTPLVHDVDPNLFPGSDQDTRPESIAAQNSRVFVVGKRVTERAVDGRNYSRALEAYAIHYYQVTCGSVVWTGNFTTANIPFGMTYQDLPQLDPTNPGATITPTLLNDRTQTIVDPHTGALIRRISLPADSPYDPGNPATKGPYMFSSGAPRICGTSLMGSPAVGYLCAFAQGDGGPEALYYIVPSTGESRYLGWSFSVGVINPSDSKFYADNADNLTQWTYTGSYATSVASGTWAALTPTVLMYGIQAAVHTFDSSFVAADFGCGIEVSMGDFVYMNCRRGVQDSYGWVVVFRISTAAVIAATRVDANVKCRWCAIHQIVAMYDQPAVQIITHYFVGGGGVGLGPYTATYTGSGTLDAATTTIQVSGEPSCSSCGSDADVALARAGDVFTIDSESMRIETKTSSTSWIVTRGVGGTTAASHAPSATLTGSCDMTPIFWKLLSDPHGKDTTSTYFIPDAPWAAVSGHDDAGTGLLLSEAGDGWVIRIGDLIAEIGQPVTRTIPSAATFGGQPANCYGNSCREHPSAGAPGAPWLTDFPLWDFGGGDEYTPTLLHISGQVYKLIGSYGPISPKHFAIAGAVDATWTGGPHSILDVSPATLGTTGADSYKSCTANAAGECYAGSSKGDVYVNLPGSPNLYCNSGIDPCLANFSMLANGVVQIGTAGGMTRVISGGLTGLRNTNDYPTAKALGDGSYLLFAHGDVTHYPPSQMLMAKLPPFTRQDTVVRTTFVRSPISIAAPQGQRIASAAIEFGYTEQGDASQHYCTSRREACVAVSATVNDAAPFYYAQTETYTRMPCARSCTITLPVLPAHVAFYQVKFYDAQGVLVAPGDGGVSVEGAAVKPGGGAANAIQ